MAYEPQQYTAEEAEAKVRRLKMQQLRYQGDLRKIERALTDIEARGKQLYTELQRTEALIVQQKKEAAALTEKKRFIDDEMRAIKRKLLNLTGK